MEPDMAAANPSALLATARKRSPLFTEKDAAEFLQTTPRTLQAWRIRGGGPRFVKCSRLVRYREEDLNLWLDQQARSSTSDAGR